MIHGVALSARPDWSHGVSRGRHNPGPPPQVRVAARAATLDSKIVTSAALRMTTSDGDTVSISLAAVEQLHSEAFRGAVGGTRLDYRNTSQSSNVSVQINIDGSLDAEEMADIRELLAQLNNTSGDPRAAPDATEFAEGGGLDSLQSFQYSYQRQASVEYSSKRLVAFA